MRKLLCFLVAAAAVSFAQNISIKNVEELQLNGNYYYPKLSEDGSKLLLTSVNHKGLWVYDLNSNSLTQLNDYLGAGYEPLFADDGSKVIFKRDDYSDQRKYSTLISQDINTKQESVIEPRGRFISEVQRSSLNSLAYMKNYQMNTIAENTAQKISNSSSAAVYIENSDLILFQNGEKKIINPLDEGNYIWPSLSPDRTKILFTLAGGGTYISDLNGNILADLGYANAPQWSADGNWIVYMNDKDDGYEFVSSDILIVSADGSERRQITSTDDIIEMHPNWDNQKMIVFNSVDGRIFIVELD